MISQVSPKSHGSQRRKLMNKVRHHRTKLGNSLFSFFQRLPHQKFQRVDVYAALCICPRSYVAWKLCQRERRRRYTFSHSHLEHVRGTSFRRGICDWMMVRSRPTANWRIKKAKNSTFECRESVATNPIVGSCRVYTSERKRKESKSATVLA